MGVLVPHRRLDFKTLISLLGRNLVFVAISLVGIGAGTQAAAQQADPEYMLDGSRIFWFVHITDTHVDSILPRSDLRMHWVVTEGIPTVAPDFVVNTGDLTDSTNGILYGVGPWEDEWIKYRAHLDNAGFTPDFYYDLPGNHDQYGDAELAYYRQYSMWGSANDTTQPYWTFDAPFGRYFFFGAATTGNDGAQWPADHETFTDWELDELEEALEVHGTDADLIFLFGHHDYHDVEHWDQFLDIVTPYGPPRFFGHGHEHDHVASLADDGIIRYRTSSVGQASRENFAVWAVDANAVSIGVYDARDAWPAVLITAPVDSNLLGVENPYAPPVPNSCEVAPVRALVFDTEPVEWAGFRWDDGAWWPMTQRQDRPEQWRGYTDTTGLSLGVHTLTVEAHGTETRSRTIDVHIVEGPCDLGDEDPEYVEDLGVDSVETPDDMGADVDGAGDPDVVDITGDYQRDVVDADDSDSSQPDSVDTDAEPNEDQGDIIADLVDGGTGSLDPEDGCGCRSGHVDPDSTSWLPLALLLVFVRRRAGD